MMQSMCVLGEAYRNRLIKDSISVEFKFLYANIILKLKEHNLLSKEYDAYGISRLEQLLSKENKASDDRYFINSFFTHLSENDRGIVSEYANYFYEKLIDNFRDSIIYINTDIAYFTQVNNSIIEVYNKTNIPFNMSKIEYLYFLDERKYIYKKLSDIKCSYILRLKIKESIQTFNELNSKFLCEIRNDKLNQILI